MSAALSCFDVDFVYDQSLSGMDSDSLLFYAIFYAIMLPAILFFQFVCGLVTMRGLLLLAALLVSSPSPASWVKPSCM